MARTEAAPTAGGSENFDRLARPPSLAARVEQLLRRAISEGRFPDGLAIDVDGNLYVCCYASDEIWRIAPDGVQTLIAHDRWGIKLGRPTNLAFGGPKHNEIYIANLGRYTITRAELGIVGQRLANLQVQ